MLGIILGLAAWLAVVNGVLNAISKVHSNGFTNKYVIQEMDKDGQVVIYKNIKTKNIKTGEIKKEPFSEFRLDMRSRYIDI